MEPEVSTLTLASDSVARWNESLARIMESNFDDAVLRDLLTALELLIDGKSSSIMVCPPGKMPFAACHTLLPDEDPAFHIDTYLKGAYLVDPCYLMAKEQALEGLWTTLDVAPEGFETSEYYRIYYHATNLKDDAVFVLNDEDGSVILLSIGRHTDASRFLAQEKALLKTLFPLVKVIVTRCLRNRDSSALTPGMERELDLALKHFGTSLLTERESMILNLLLRGHSIKSIADSLDNSVETIKHHRKNIYLKLDVSSQAELFHLFIDSLRSYNPGEHKDPLTAYMSV